MMPPMFPPPLHGMRRPRNFSNFSSTSSCGHHPRDCDFAHDFSVIALPVLIIIIVIGFVTNILVLYIIAANKTMRTVPNCYAANICITDIIFLIMATLSDVMEYAFGVSGMNKTVIPRSVSVYFHLVLTNATCAMLCALAFDRYLAIVHPFRFRRFRTVKFAFIVGLVAWFVSFAVCTPIYAGEFSESIYERFSFNDFLLAIIISCIFSYVIPLLVIACCYVTIICSLWHKATPLRGSSLSHPSSSNGLDSRMLKRNLVVLKSVLIIALVFALNYGIFYSIYLWLSLCAPQDFRKTFTASHIVSIMGCVGLCLNPIIYGLMQPNFRPYLENMRESIKKRCSQCCERTRDFKEVNSNAITTGTKETSFTESRKDLDEVD